MGCRTFVHEPIFLELFATCSFEIWNERAVSPTVLLLYFHPFVQQDRWTVHFLV